MILLDNVLVSLDIFEKKFACDLKKCLGNCCVEGDYGAPLENKEIKIISSSLPKIRPFMSRPGLDLLDKEGFHETDPFGQKVTKCITNKHCIFVFRDKKINLCAIEKAWMEGKTVFQKPVSCHLYPIRLTNLKGLIAANYSKWEICKPALELGKKKGIPLFVFLKDPLIRKFGKKWYNEIARIAKEIEKEGLKF